MKEYMFILVPIIGAILCQIIKFIVESINDKKLNFERLFNGAGGIPSTHTTLVFCLVFTILFNEGVTSTFAVSLMLALIVSYDAMGVRFESGLQAEAINKLITAVFKTKKKQKLVFLKEELGHKPFEVLTGICFALLVSVVAYYII